jgi:CBS domain containing-hemolysin-like protein
MAEIALVSARKARLEAQANKGDKSAKEALELANHPDTFLSTVQIGITLIGILTGILSGEKLKSDFVAFLNRFDSIADYSNGIATCHHCYHNHLLFNGTRRTSTQEARTRQGRKPLPNSWRDLCTS